MKLNPETEGVPRTGAPSAPASAILKAAADWVVRRDAGFSPADEAAWGDWLAEDPGHRRAWAQLEGAWSAMDRPRRAGITDWVMLEIKGLARRRRQRRQRWAALGVVVLLIGGATWRVQHRGPVLSPAAATIAVSQPAQRVLPDGSVVELKGDAEIEVDFSGPLRRVALRRGEALFRVAKNHQRPFVVQADRLEVRAVGTRFSVALGSSEVGVLVTEGRVAVNQTETGRNGAAGALRTLAYVDAGKGIVVRPGSAEGMEPKVLDVPPSEMDERLAWLSARLEFSNTPLAEAVALMNQHNRVQFLIDDPSLNSVHISGFIREDNAEAFKGFLEAYFQVKTERRGENEIVLRRAP